MQHVILINGLGNRTFFYHVVLKLWRIWGFNLHFFRFDWEDSEESFESKMKRLTTACEQFDIVKVIGISAGGTAAVNLLAQAHNVSKVATVGSPYYLTGVVKSQLLQESSNVLAKNLAHFSRSKQQKIRSFHGASDSTVSPRQSQSAGITHTQLKTYGHIATIVYALTIGSRPLRRFLNT